MIYIYLLHFSESKLFYFIILITCNYKSHQIWSERRLRQISLFFLLCENRVPKRPPPSPLEKKIQEPCVYFHHLKTCPICTLCTIRSHVHVRGLPTMAWDDDCHVPHASPLNQPPLFWKISGSAMVLHFCGSDCQYMYRYMYMHPPPTPTKYRIFTIRKHAFLSLFLNDTMLRACRSM